MMRMTLTLWNKPFGKTGGNNNTNKNNKDKNQNKNTPPNDKGGNGKDTSGKDTSEEHRSDGKDDSGKDSSQDYKGHSESEDEDEDEDESGSNDNDSKDEDDSNDHKDTDEASSDRGNGKGNGNNEEKISVPTPNPENVDVNPTTITQENHEKSDNNNTISTNITNECSDEAGHVGRKYASQGCRENNQTSKSGQNPDQDKVTDNAENTPVYCKETQQITHDNVNLTNQEKSAVLSTQNNESTPLYPVISVPIVPISVPSVSFECYYCNFKTDMENQYRRHVVNNHHNKAAYPTKAEIESLGLESKGRHWEI